MGKSQQEGLQESVHMETGTARGLIGRWRFGRGGVMAILRLAARPCAEQFWGWCLCRARLEITVLRKPLVTGLESSLEAGLSLR